MTIENYYINNNENVKNVINSILKKIGFDKMNEIFGIKIKKWDGSDEQWNSLAQSIGGQGLLFNPNYTSLAAPLVPANDGFEPIIAIRDTLANESTPAILSSLSYSIFYVYFHNQQAKANIIHDMQTVMMAVSYFSEYESVKMLLEWMQEKHIPATAKDLRESALEELSAIKELPEKSANESIPQFAMSYLAKLRVMREMKLIPADEVWAQAEKFFTPKFGASWDVIKGMFVDYYKDFSDVIKQACEE